MQGKPQDAMQVGMIHFMLYPEVMKGEGPVVETLEKICNDDYFQAVEVTWVKDAGVRKKAIEVARASGKAVGFGSQPPLLIGKCDLNSSDADTRQKAIDQAKDSIDQATEWGAKGIAVLSGPDPGEQKRASGNDLLIDSLKQLCSYSQEKGGPPVLLETFDRQPFGKNCLVGPTSEAVEIARAVRAEFPSFGLMVDLSHLPLLSESAAECISTVGEYLSHVHIGNCVMKDSEHPAYGDNHPMFGIPGGENNVDELADFLKALMDGGYLGEGKKPIVSFEVKPYGDQTSQEVLDNAKATLDAAWAKL